jgi:predicted DNA-binding transcriptional regulator AlpA
LHRPLDLHLLRLHLMAEIYDYLSGDCVLARVPNPDRLAGFLARVVDMHVRGIGGGERRQAVDDLRQVAPSQYSDLPYGELVGWARGEMTAWQAAERRYHQTLHRLPVGAVEIAERLDVNRSTVDQWRQRGLLPDPTWTVGGRPAWDWAVIAAWAKATGRLT